MRKCAAHGARWRSGKNRRPGQIVAGIVGNAFAARAGVRHHQNNAQLGSNPLRACFGGEVLIVAGQA
jgi:hypothetical protein